MSLDVLNEVGKFLTGISTGTCIGTGTWQEKQKDLPGEINLPCTGRTRTLRNCSFTNQNNKC